MYGMGPDRRGMVCCPFHSDNHPSMLLNDTYYYCFACGANGDAIDLTAKLFDLNPRQAAEKLAHDFGLDPDKPPANAIALPPPKRGLTDEQWADIAYCLRVLTDYLDLLHDWQERYKPATPEEPHDPRFEEALHMTETVEHLTDCVAFGIPQQKADAAAQLLSGSYLLMLEERTDRLALAKCA
ncbi:MAG TPA: DNA primase [Faecalibacterium sp.]|nr:DNA primase [Faecalibacterium sp.]